MKTQSFLTGAAALAPVVAGANIYRRHGGRHSDSVQVIDVVSTVVDYQTVWGGPNPTSGADPSIQNNPFSGLSVTAVSSTVASASSVSISALANGEIAASNVPTTLATATQSSAAAKLTAATENSTARLSSTNLSPNGKKAGLSGYIGIQQKSGFSELSPYISWYSDYTPVPPNAGSVQGIGMLWGASGSSCGSVITDRVNEFNNLVSSSTPSIMFGFYEPDCSCSDSSEMSTSAGTAAWNQYLAPLAAKGTVLGSPSMCKQKDEDWLTPFSKSGSSSLLHADWQVTSIHINKPDLQGVMEDVDYYVRKYQKPVWVSEFACVNDQSSWQPCTDQAQIDKFIQDAVKFFQAHESVVAYGPSNGDGLGNVWPLTDSSGKLTATGQTYLNAIKGL